MAKYGDPCPSCGQAEPHTKFTLIQPRDRRTGRQLPIWQRPQQCDTCKKEKGHRAPTVSGRWAQSVGRRGLAKNARCDFTMKEWQRALTYFEGRCAYCGADERITRDHVHPIIRGGEHTASNIVPACGPCNVLKDDQPLETFADPATVDRIRAFFASLDDDNRDDQEPA